MTPDPDEAREPPAVAAPGGSLAFTVASWFTWTAVGVAFPAFAVLLVPAAGLLAQGVYEAFPVFAVTHLATLGWATMTAFGAVLQIAPVLLGARVRGDRAVPWLYGVFTLSVSAVVGGLAGGRLGLAVAGGVGVNCAAWWFLGLVGATVLAARGHGRALTPHLPAAFLCLAAVLIWGVVLAANLLWGFWPALLIDHRGLVVHLTLGLGGWLGLMIVGAFYRLVPLEHGARVASAGRGWAVLVLAGIAICSALYGVGAGAAWPFRLAAASAAAALLLFCWEVCHVLAHRRSRAPDLNVIHWYAVAVYSVVLAIIGGGWGLGWIRTSPPGRLGECVTALFLLGWVTQAIIGQLYKVTPFLMWYYRATIPDVRAIPRQPAPYYPPLGRAVLWLSNAGAVALTIGIWSGAGPAAVGGSVLLAAAALGLAYVLAYRWIPPVVAGALRFEWRWRIS